MVYAACNTGVATRREVFTSVRYRPAYARYKVYIIDAVHILSNSSFNALLETLEGQPANVKLLMATTEVKKELASDERPCWPRFGLG